MTRSDLELLAPVGSQEALTAACNSGADAVYLGIGELDMRAGATHAFTLDTLPDAVAQAHEAGLRLYVTLNAVAYPEELPGLPALLRAVQRAGADAVIAADIAVIEAAAEAGLSVHLSTQCNVSNMAALRHYARWADVVVLARELNLGQVSDIANDVASEHLRGPAGRPLRLEMFAHGALCMAVSGKCYMSLDLLASSANRGHCLQPCRRAYRLLNDEDGTEIDVQGKNLMSPRDLCTIPILPRLVEAGATVFKIEGRARQADYVATVCRVYDEALRRVAQGGPYTPGDVEHWQRRLATVFNRGFWQGNYLGQSMGEWAEQTGNQASRRKAFAGLVTNYYAKPAVAEVKLQSEALAEGDSLYIMGASTGCVECHIAGLRDADCQPARAVDKGRVCTFAAPRCRAGDKVYKLSDVD